MNLAFALLTFALFIAGIFVAGTKLGGPFLGFVLALVALVALAWFIYRTYWPDLQQGIENTWKSISFTGEK